MRSLQQSGNYLRCKCLCQSIRNTHEGISTETKQHAQPPNLALAQDTGRHEFHGDHGTVLATLALTRVPGTGFTEKRSVLVKLVFKHDHDKLTDQYASFVSIRKLCVQKYSESRTFIETRRSSIKQE